MEFLVFVLFVLLEPIFTPPVVALEVASTWIEGHPLAVWAAVATLDLAILVLYARFIENDISDEALR